MKSTILMLISIGLLLTELTGCAPARSTTDLFPLRNELRQLRQLQQQQTVLIDQNRDKLLAVAAQMQEQQNRLSELATQKVTPTRQIAASSHPVFTSATAPTDTDNQGGAATKIYLRAFSDYAAGRFERAIQGFETFLRRYAHSGYAGNAQYWLGECYYSQQQYSRAVEEFQRTVERYPQGNKTPDALLKMASALIQLGRPGRAEEALQVLRSRYPDSPAARKPLRVN